MSVSIKSPTSTTGSIQLNGSDVLTIDSSGNLTAPNNLTVTGTVTQTGSATFNGGITGNVAFDTNTLYVDATNNRVGIGTTSPNHELTIEGVANNGGIRVSNPSGQNNCSIMLTSTGTDNGFRMNYNTTNDALIWNTTTGNGTIVGELMRITSSGKVGINVTNPLAALHIKGNNNPTSYFQVDSNGNQAIIFKNVSDTTVGNITVNASTTAYNTSSDYRLKNNVAPMSGSIDRLKQLKPSTWSWVQDGSHGEGFLAHEAQSVVPEAVTGTKDAMRTEEYEVTPAVLDDDGNVVTKAVIGTREVPDYQGIDQAKLVPLLTAALQEAITKIEDLETRIQALENPNG